MDLTLGLVTDLHFGPDTWFHGKLRKLCHHAPKLSADFVQTMNDVVRPDLVVNLGDDIEDVDHATDLRLYGECQAILRTACCPLVNVAGNHDLINLTPEDLHAVWGSPADRRLYGAFDHGGWHLVVLHTVERKNVDVRVDAAQLSWLRDDLRATAKPTLVFMHHSAAEQDLEDSRWFRGVPHLALVQERADLRRILEESGRVRAVFNGHLHRNHLDVIRGIPYVTLQSLIENVDDDAPGRAAGAYTVVRASEKRLVVRVHGADPARYQFELG